MRGSKARFTTLLDDTIQSTSTTYVAGTTINTSGLTDIVVVPEVTVAVAGKSVTYKAQYSHDGTNWMDYTVDVATSGAYTQDVGTYTVSAATTGYKTSNGAVFAVRSYYFRLASKSSDASTLAVKFHITGR
jgi:hypothetical protein